MIKKKAAGYSIGIMILGSVLSAQGEETVKMPKPEAEAVWKHISQENPFTIWSTWEHRQGPHTGNAAFSEGHKVYANKQAVESKNTPLQNKSMMVSYIMGPDNKPQAVTLMYKVKGYNPAAGDWFWAKYGLSGEVQVAGKPQGCIACHTKQADNDYILDHMYYYMEKEETTSASEAAATVPEPSSEPKATETAPADTPVVKKDGPLDPATMLAAHNQWRSKTGVPDLKWLDDLAASAQKWADQLTKSGCTVKHSTSKHGENIYWAGAAQGSDGSSSMQEISEQNVVDAWGNEVKGYDYTTNSCHGVCGHYTQVVWKSTTEVGCGMAVCSDKAQIWVCQYSPRGNMVGEKPY